MLVNPPWRLDEELRQLLPGLAPILAGGDGGSARIDWIAGEL
jgi:23S rRNA A2030 N6-methylase RlmJ